MYLREPGLSQPHLPPSLCDKPNAFPLEKAIDPKACREASSSSDEALSCVIDDMVERSANSK